MSRTKELIPKQDKKIHLPIPLIIKVNRILTRNGRQKLPFGAWAKLVERLLREWVERIESLENEVRKK